MGSWFSFTVALARSTFSTTPFPEMRLVVAGEAVAVLAAATELTPGVPISFPGAAFCCCKSSSLDDAASYVRELAKTLGDVASSAAGWIIWLPDAKVPHLQAPVQVAMQQKIELSFRSPGFELPQYREQ